MPTTKSTALAKPASAELVAALGNSFPVEEGFTSVALPRITFVSQDKTEKVKGKDGKTKVNLITAAGTFFRESQKKDDDGKLVLDEDTGKPIWDTDELGSEVDLDIVFQRKQLKYYDKGTGAFTSSNVYDENEEEVVLYTNRTEVKRGKPADLKKDYEFKDENGKVKTALEDNRVLYVLYKPEGEEQASMHQMNLRGSSMYAFMTYARQCRPNVPAVITHITSEPKKNGSNEWNQMVFEAARPISNDEAKFAAESIAELVGSIAERKSRFSANRDADAAFASVKGRGE